MRILVLINCSKRKTVDMGQVARELARHGIDHLPSTDLEREGDYRVVLGKWAKRAIDMYDGPEARVVREVAKALGPQVDIYILSARYGVVGGGDIVIPYEAYLGHLSEDFLDSLAKMWMVRGPGRIRELRRGGWDIGIVRLTKAYLGLVPRLNIDPCGLAREIHVLGPMLAKSIFNCPNAKIHLVKGSGHAASLLAKLINDLVHANLSK